MLQYFLILLMYILCSTFVDSAFRMLSEPDAPNANRTLIFNQPYGSICGIGCPQCDISLGGNKAVMYQPMDLYHIYIAKSIDDYAPSTSFYKIATKFAEGISLGSNYTDILKYYKDGAGRTSTTTFNYTASFTWIFNGNTITTANVTNALKAAAASGIPLDANAAYVLFFRGDYKFVTSS